jgi:hypothetical protein
MQKAAEDRDNKELTDQTRAGGGTSLEVKDLAFQKGKAGAPAASRTEGRALGDRRIGNATARRRAKETTELQDV